MSADTEQYHNSSARRTDNLRSRWHTSKLLKSRNLQQLGLAVLKRMMEGLHSHRLLLLKTCKTRNPGRVKLQTLSSNMVHSSA